MSAFLTALVMTGASDLDDGRWRLLKPLEYQSDVAGRVIVVPEGFETDLASVPRLPVVYLLTGDTSSKAAVVHDYLYSTGEVSRKVADAVLKEASAVIGVSGWRRWLMWAGVRIGGSGRYAGSPGGTPAAPGQ